MIGAAAFLPSFFLCVRVRETEVGDGRKEGKRAVGKKRETPCSKIRATNKGSGIKQHPKNQPIVECRGRIGGDSLSVISFWS